MSYSLIFKLFHVLDQTTGNDDGSGNSDQDNLAVESDHSAGPIVEPQVEDSSAISQADQDPFNVDAEFFDDVSGSESIAITDFFGEPVQAVHVRFFKYCFIVQIEIAF